MNTMVILAEMAVFALLFTVMCFATTGRNSTVQLDNYPPEIRDEYLRTHPQVPKEALTRGRIVKKAVAVLVFAVLLAGMARLAGARSFSQGFLLAFGLMVWIGVFDTFFIDWVLFANMKRFRLEGTEHMDREYHQKWFHLKGMLFPGILFALIPAALAGLLVRWIG